MYYLCTIVTSKHDKPCRLSRYPQTTPLGGSRSRTETQHRPYILIRRTCAYLSIRLVCQYMLWGLLPHRRASFYRLSSMIQKSNICIYIYEHVTKRTGGTTKYQRQHHAQYCNGHQTHNINTEYRLLLDLLEPTRHLVYLLY